MRAHAGPVDHHHVHVMRVGDGLHDAVPVTRIAPSVEAVVDGCRRAVLAGQITGQCDTGAEHGDGQQREGLLTQQQQDEDRRERQEPGNFPQALQHADFAPGKRRLLDDEIIEQGLPHGKRKRC